MSKLSIGTVQFGLNYGIANSSSSKVPFLEVKSILSFAKKRNIKTLDTAVSYGDSEKILGKIGVDDFDVITKLPPIIEEEYQHNIPLWCRKHLLSSLKKLRTEVLHGILLHDHIQLTKPYGSELFEALQKLKAEGLVKKVGISIYQPEDLEDIWNKFSIDIVQLPLNILDNRWSLVLKELHQNSVEIHARSIFLQGLLLMPLEKRPKKFNKWSKIWKIWKDWLYVNKLSPLEASLSYISSIPEISKFIIGVISEKQLEEIHKIKRNELPKIPDELRTNDITLLNPSNWKSL